MRAVGIVRRGEATSSLMRPRSHHQPKAKNAAMTDAANASGPAVEPTAGAATGAPPINRQSPANTSTPTMASLRPPVQAITLAPTDKPLVMTRAHATIAATATTVV